MDLSIADNTGGVHNDKNTLLRSMQSQMLELLSCGVIAYTMPERNILMVNAEAQRIFEHDTENDSLMHSMTAHLLPEDHDTVRNATMVLKKPGDRCRYLIHSKLHDGDVLVLDCTTKLIEYEPGSSYILSVIQDVTERESTAALLKRERKQFREALITRSEFAYTADMTEGMIYNDFEYSKNGRSIVKSLGVSFPIRYDDMINAWLRVKKPVFLTPEKYNTATSADLVRYYEEGKTHIIIEYYLPDSKEYLRNNILLSKDESSGHVIAMIYDVDFTDTMSEDTKQRNQLALMNKALEDQLEITRSLSSIYFSSWAVDLVSNTISEISSPDWLREKILPCGGDFRKASDIFINALIDEKSQDAVAQFINCDTMPARFKEQSILTCEYVGLHSGWCEGNIIPIRTDSEGNVTKVIIAIRLIDAEKKKELDSKCALEEAYEAANRASLAKTEFLSSVSHDIRTPMNAIIGMTAIAGTHLDDKAKVSDCLTKITKSSKHLLSLINDILDMNKIESGRFNLELDDFKLPEIIDNLLAMTKSQIVSRNHTLFVNIIDVDHENVVGDSQRVQQIILNLLSNAIKYTPDGGKISLTVSERPTNRPGIGCFEFTVEDNGIGMSEEFIPLIFEPFSRAGDARSKFIQGTGLGMSITKNIVQMMNGDISVESKLSVGTKVKVTIFLELQDIDDQLPPDALADLPVLVADDDQMACETTCNILGSLGIKGEWVLSGKDAVDKVVARHKAADDYFAVIIDWKMPGMDGVETTREIRRLVGNEVPIIIISAYDWSDIEEEAREAGANDFIAKPLFKSRVSHMFRSLLGNEQKKNEEFELDKFSHENFSGKRALVVEDNELNAEIAAEIFKMIGIDTDLAANGQLAVDAIENESINPYDIIFMDIQMPVMNGYDATRKIRELPGEYPKKVPIIAMTANAFAEDVRAAKDAGMDGHIAKPIDFDQLTNVLKQYLGR